MRDARPEGGGQLRDRTIKPFLAPLDALIATGSVEAT